MLRAKRAVEELVETGLTVVRVPKADDLSVLARDLAESGVATMAIDTGDVDVRQIRERTGLTQEQFALRFGLDVDTLQNWEAGRRAMPLAARSYMKVIEKMPEQASRALETAVTPI